jgi:hypothetical protein
MSQIEQDNENDEPAIKRTAGRTKKVTNEAISNLTEGANIPTESPTMTNTMTQAAPAKLLDTVETMLRVITEKKVRINHETGEAGVDLGSRGRPNGTQFRQLQVKADGGFIAVRLIEGFKPAHGGSEQRKTIYSLVVSVNDMKAYSLLQRRFFAYDLDRVVADADNFLNILKETIRDSNSFG